MNHDDHVALLREGVAGRVWADFGSGGGAFTLALAQLLGAGGVIQSVDRDQAALNRQARELARRFPQVSVTYHHTDFTAPLALPPLDGWVMANALHFTPPTQQKTVIEALTAHLKPGGRVIMVEYGTDIGNQWVPYPLSFASWAKLAAACDLAETRLLATRPSHFLGQIYAAGSVFSAILA